MDKRSVYILLTIMAFGFVSIFFSCEKDDICADQAVTPFLIIRFMDDEDPTEPDAVDNLQIRYIEENPDQDDDDETDDAFLVTEVFDSATDADSITLSLPIDRTDATYVFYQNYDIDVLFDDDGVETEEISPDTEMDTIVFNYVVNEEYISRACGFRATYSNLLVELISNGNAGGFIDNQNIITRIIEDEEQAHVQLRH